jgi:SAM-dependent methyltransferase
MGRHARVLSKRGYSVTGIDRNPDVIATARALAGGPTYINADVRDNRPDPGAFDVTMIISQSVGYFDAATNRRCWGEWLMEFAKAVVLSGICGAPSFSSLIRASMSSRHPVE